MWEVATACEIELGRHFQLGGAYEGRVVNIDSRAIQESARMMGITESSAQLLFTAADVTSPDMTAGEDGLTGGYAELDERTGKHKISIGINHWGRIDLLRYVIGAKPSDLYAEKPISAKKLQEKCVHELRHAVDSTSECLLATDKTERKPTKSFLLEVVRYRRSGFERRARKAARHSSDYPKIISIN